MNLQLNNKKNNPYRKDPSSVTNSFVGIVLTGFHKEPSRKILCSCNSIFVIDRELLDILVKDDQNFNLRARIPLKHSMNEFEQQ